MGNQAAPLETKETKKNKDWSDQLTKYAKRGTVLYFLVLAGLLFGRYEQFLTVSINELGDFLAGAFGPVAFLWLVIGYLMQHSELKLNRVSIEKQAEELGFSRVSLERQVSELEYTRLAYENQIAEFKRNVDISNESLKETIANRKKIEEDENFRVKPFFRIYDLTLLNSNAKFEKAVFKISNYKSEVYDLRFISEDGELLSSVIPVIRNNDDPKEVVFYRNFGLESFVLDEVEMKDIMVFFIKYTDINYREYKLKCSLKGILDNGEKNYFIVIYEFGRIEN